MQMIILCGGLGTRLREVIGEKQKTMAEIKGKPFLAIIVEYYKSLGIDNFILATGYKENEIINYFGNGEKIGVDIVYSREENPLGTGGAIKNAYDLIKEEKVFVANGDTFFKTDINLLIKNMDHYNSDMSIMLKEETEKKRYGEVLLEKNSLYGGIIKSFKEKNENIQKDTYINAGIYYIKKSLLKNIENKKISLEYDLIPKWIKEKKMITGIVSKSDFIDIGTKESLNKAKEGIDIEKNLQKVLFLDRDGTICDDYGIFGTNKYDDYEKLIEDIKLIKGVKESLKKIKQCGYMIIIISNQAGVAKGKMTEAQVQKFNKKLNEKLDNVIDGFYYCIHHNNGFEKNGECLNKNKIIKELIFNCDCRKPQIGMFLQAEEDIKNGFLQTIDEEIIQKNLIYKKDRKINKIKINKLEIDKKNSYMIGDKIDDTVAGKKYGVKTFLVKTGEGIESVKYLEDKKNIKQYTDYIVEDITEAIDVIIGEKNELYR